MNQPLYRILSIIMFNYCGPIMLSDLINQRQLAHAKVCSMLGARPSQELNADVLFIEPIETTFRDIGSEPFSVARMHLRTLSAKWRP